jgi:glycosyltransferase involved in cell wall biosynthesis
MPAFSSADTAVPGVSLVHCTSNAWPQDVEAPSLMVAYDLTFLTHSQYHTQENIRLCSGNFERAARAGAHFCAISENTRQDLIRLYDVAAEKVSLIYCGVDHSEYFPRPEAEVRALRERHRLPDRFFLFVGSLEPRKNIGTAIAALARCPADTRLVIAGAKGWSNADLHEAITAAGERVMFLGYLDESELPLLYSAAEATIYPSLYEGFGYPVVESMACGTPVITSDNSSLSEIAAGASLLLADPRDPAQIAEAFARIRDDAPLRERLRQAGLERARRFSVERMAEETLHLYGRLAS